MLLRAWTGVLLMLLISGCAGLRSTAEFEAPQVSLSDIRLKEVGLLEQRFVLDLRIGNPNPVPLPIGGMEYRFSVNEEEYARGVSNQVLTVAPYSEERLSVELTSNTALLLGQLRRFSDRQADLRYELRGSIYVPKLDSELPFTAKGRFDDGTEHLPPGDEPLL